MKAKRVAAYLLAVGMVVSVLGGCGNSESSGESAASASTGGGQTAVWL